MINCGSQLCPDSHALLDATMIAGGEVDPRRTPQINIDRSYPDVWGRPHPRRRADRDIVAPQALPTRQEWRLKELNLLAEGWVIRLVIPSI